MSMRRRRCSHCVSASVASAVVIAVVVSSLIKLLTVTACAFVPVMSFVLLPLCFGSMRGMSESRCDLPSADRANLGIGFGSRACRFVILLGVGYGASVLCTYMPMSTCILFPFTREVVSYSSRCAAYVTIGIAIVIVFVSRFVKLLTVTACAFVPVMSFVLLPLCFGSMRGMSESRCDLPSADAAYLGIGFCSRACRYVILLCIGYGASVLRTYVPMSAYILFPFAGEVVRNLSYCVTNLASGVTSIVRIVAVRSFFEMLVASSTSLPVMRCVRRPFGCRAMSVVKLCRHLILTNRAILCRFFGCSRDVRRVGLNLIVFVTALHGTYVSVSRSILVFPSVAEGMLCVFAVRLLTGRADRKSDTSILTACAIAFVLSVITVVYRTSVVVPACIRFFRILGSPSSRHLVCAYRRALKEGIGITLRAYIAVYASIVVGVMRLTICTFCLEVCRAFGLLRVAVSVSICHLMTASVAELILGTGCIVHRLMYRHIRVCVAKPTFVCVVFVVYAHPYRRIVCVVTKVAVDLSTGCTFCLMLTVLRAARMSCSAVCLFASAYATYVPVFGFALFELAVIVSDRSRCVTYVTGRIASVIIGMLVLAVYLTIVCHAIVPMVFGIVFPSSSLAVNVV